MTPTWHAVDGAGRDLATGRPPETTGSPTPAVAVAAAPVIEWPVRVVDGEGRAVGLEAVLGAGGERVVSLLSGLV
ncbi:MAG: hypothetical protein M3179_01650, partial [Actinomycetota bacterium]|nr:hypothetical protein [Actinomycetota bacterium]